MDEARLTTLAASSSVAAAALAFALKLARDFVADKSRRAASLRIVAVYIRLAVKEWEHEDMDRERGDERSIANLSSVIDNIGTPPPAGSGLDPFTPYVAFSPHDDLSVAEVRDFPRLPGQQDDRKRGEFHPGGGDGPRARRGLQERVRPSAV